jgi:hypothetical protein
VAIFYGADSDAPEVKVVQSDLKKLGVPVALTAEDSVQATDAVASDQEVQSIAQRFQSDGVKVVVGVGGSGSTTWPRAQLDNQSTYKPVFIATDESHSFPTWSRPRAPIRTWTPCTGSDRRAVELPAVEGPGDARSARPSYHKAYPSDPMTRRSIPPVPGSGQQHGHDVRLGPRGCQYLGLFAKIADAAGKNLTWRASPRRAMG